MRLLIYHPEGTCFRWSDGSMAHPGPAVDPWIQLWSHHYIIIILEAYLICTLLCFVSYFFLYSYT